MTDFLNQPALEEAIQEKIDATLEKTVAEAVRDALHEYSDIGKSIKSAVKEAFVVEDFDLPKYNENIKRIVRDLVAKQTNDAAAQLEETLAEIIEPLPAEIKLSEIIKRFVEEEGINEDGYGEMTLIVEDDHKYGWHEIYWDSDANEDKRSCKYRMTVNKDGAILSGSAGFRGDFDKKQPYFFGRAHGVEQLMISLYCNGTKVIVDEDDCETSFEPY